MGQPGAGGYLSMTATALFALVRDAARAMAGVRSYPAYRDHMLRHHPEVKPMNERDFFRNRQEAHYGGGKHSSCC